MSPRRKSSPDTEKTVDSDSVQRLSRRKLQQPHDDTRYLDARTMKPIQKERATICERIRYYREKLGIEQKELGRRIGVIGNTVCNWENGRGRPDVSLLPNICEALNISLYDLYDIPMPVDRYSADEQDMINRFRDLTDCHKHVLRGVLERLEQAQEIEQYREIVKLVYHEKQLAAGFDPGLEFDDIGEPIYLYASDEVNRADSVFSVSGDSMEPEYHDGDMVLVQEFPNCPQLQPGEVGAFIIGNETYIKVYGEDGLHSYNRAYKTMKFNEDDRVFLIGKVIGTLTDDDIPTDADMKRYHRIHSGD